MSNAYCVVARNAPSDYHAPSKKRISNARHHSPRARAHTTTSMHMRLHGAMPMHFICSRTTAVLHARNARRRSYSARSARLHSIRAACFLQRWAGDRHLRP